MHVPRFCMKDNDFENLKLSRLMLKTPTKKSLRRLLCRDQPSYRLWKISPDRPHRGKNLTGCSNTSFLDEMGHQHLPPLLYPNTTVTLLVLRLPLLLALHNNNLDPTLVHRMGHSRGMTRRCRLPLTGPSLHLQSRVDPLHLHQQDPLHLGFLGLHPFPTQHLLPLFQRKGHLWEVVWWMAQSRCLSEQQHHKCPHLFMDRRTLRRLRANRPEIH